MRDTRGCNGNGEKTSRTRSEAAALLEPCNVLPPRPAPPRAAAAPLRAEAVTLRSCTVNCTALDAQGLAIDGRRGRQRCIKWHCRHPTLLGSRGGAGRGEYRERTRHGAGPAGALRGTTPRPGPRPHAPPAACARVQRLRPCSTMHAQMSSARSTKRGAREGPACTGFPPRVDFHSIFTLVIFLSSAKRTISPDWTAARCRSMCKLRGEAGCQRTGREAPAWLAPGLRRPGAPSRPRPGCRAPDLQGTAPQRRRNLPRQCSCRWRPARRAASLGAPQARHTPA